MMHDYGDGSLSAILERRQEREDLMMEEKRKKRKEVDKKQIIQQMLNNVILDRVIICSINEEIRGIIVIESFLKFSGIFSIQNILIDVEITFVSSTSPIGRCLLYCSEKGHRHVYSVQQEQEEEIVCDIVGIIPLDDIRQKILDSI